MLQWTRLQNSGDHYYHVTAWHQAGRVTGKLWKKDATVWNIHHNVGNLCIRVHHHGRTSDDLQQWNKSTNGKYLVVKAMRRWNT